MNGMADYAYGIADYACCMADYACCMADYAYGMAVNNNLSVFFRRLHAWFRCCFDGNRHHCFVHCFHHCLIVLEYVS